MGNAARKRTKPLWRRRQGSTTGGWGPLTKQQQDKNFRNRPGREGLGLEQQEQKHRQDVAEAKRKGLWPPTKPQPVS